MITLKILNRPSSTALNHKILATSILQKFCTKSGGSNDGNAEDVDKNKVEGNAQDVNKESNKKAAAKNKLNLLLKQMLQDDVQKSGTKLDLARPRAKKQAKEETSSLERKETNILKAVKNVAKEFGNDAKQTESELLNKLLDNQDKSSLNLSELVRGMKIDREAKGTEQISRAKQVKILLDRASNRKSASTTEMMPKKFTRRQKQFTPIEVKRIDLYGSEPLNIFEPADCEKPVENVNKTWRALHERELRLAVTHPPSNYFQEMILWTEQGKLWRFPIDNEQEIGDENDVYFAEHVFLEKHLEPWCPTRGPIRHFMELVCVGLSKNHRLTVKEKREHIEWYRDYFNEKSKLLAEVGAVPAGHAFEKQIEDK